ncbi:MAG: sodium:calcium antiporter [Candidatus Nealsonbacteria bacterium]
MILFYIFIFLASFALLFWSGKWLVDTLTRVARFLEWREFVVAFFVMAIAGSLPNLFVGISSALHKIPQLSFGDVVGGNLVDLTIVVALAALIAKGLPAKSRMVQTSSIFTICIAILPLLLILDGVLGRGDGIFLILVFAFYVFWLFSREERFKKVYEENKISITKEFKVFIKDLGKVIFGIIFLLAAAEGIVKSVQFFAGSFNLPIALIGILIVGLGNALPEAYFAIASARKGQTWMILGNLMGAIMIPATLVLGIVALICPIEIVDFSPFAIGRLFLVISAIFFLWVVRSGQKITKKEALFLLGIYVLFVIIEILMK